MKKWLLLFHTLRHLKWQQFYFRIWRKLVKPRVTETYHGRVPNRPSHWHHAVLYPEKLSREGVALFLNLSKALALPGDWNSEEPSKLWVYNLHYFEDLLSDDAKSKRSFHAELLERWVDENPVGYGNGWEPYPTSLRIANILKAWLGGLDLSPKLFTSVFEQASYLSNDLEKHLLGNHYFVNLKALLFAGVVFEHAAWLEVAEAGLLVEIPEQVMEDGANFELSPMYHALILVDMLDMHNLCSAYPERVSKRLFALLTTYIPKMLSFLDAMSHPDNGVAFFNDSADGIAPHNERIGRYAAALGFSGPAEPRASQVVDNYASGYLCANLAGSKLIFDVGDVGPDYIPGHAHADTLSFEMSIGQQRVFVNSGTSLYGLGEERLRQRKTLAHNTLVIDNKDSSEVWSGFRVARRARITQRAFKVTADSNIRLNGAHNGYKRWFGGCIHKRSLGLAKNKLTIVDQLEGTFESAVSRLYFHPSLAVKLDGDSLEVAGDAFLMTAELSQCNAHLLDSTWHPEFGLAIPNKMLELELLTDRLEVTFAWGHR